MGERGLNEQTSSQNNARSSYNLFIFIIYTKDFYARTVCFVY